MAEVKNSFLSSKMNKDLDDRLIPNSQYRDALNISIGKSEQDQIGTVQNVLGNYQLTKTVHGVTTPLETNTNLVCIGYWMDNQNNRIYRFLTDYTDPSPSAITMAPEGTTHKITVYDFNTLTYNTLVEGIFLNFSTTNLIIGVNLLEGLLFWTDNRNQPRKINYFNAINNPTYYTTETQISVAKYAPIEAPILFREVNTTAISVSDLTITVDDATGIEVGMTLISIGVSSCEYATVLTVVDNFVTMYSFGEGSVDPGDKLRFLGSTMSNQANNPNWPGDPAYIESKYIRFSYRFKFDDNEYSIFAPFSQIAYIPKQKGYFISGDEQAAYRSTILKWMENNINNVEILIPLPDKGNNINKSYKITNVEVLYKESDSLAVKVLDTVSYLTISSSPGANTNIYTYKYQSQKPYKTLPEDQITRVYDKVPTRALAQEMASNRVIYGNFHTTYTPPKYIDYKVGAQAKNQAFSNFIEYPNHTLKQNRNYQVGFILADKFGRQSSVILSVVDSTTTVGSTSYGSSTIYSPYVPKDDALFPGVGCWKGNALRVLVNNTINSTRNISAGTPGLYAEQIANGFAISNATISNERLTYTFTVDSSPIPNPDYPTAIPEIGDYMRGKYTDYVKITNVEWVIYPAPVSPPFTTNDRNDFPNPPYGDYIITTDGNISNLYLYEEAPINVKYAYSLNEIGWYSYKVVVKQREQDYYNVYLPGMLDGYPVNQTTGSQVTYNEGTATLQNGINTTSFPTNETGKTSHVVLINDNINKVPRDLAEVGPDQKQYRSSVELYGRVENYPNKITFTANALPETDYYAEQIYFTISTTVDLFNLVNIGDGIQCNIPNAPPGETFPKWYADTVITAIEKFYFYLNTSAISLIGTIIHVPLYEDIQIGDSISYAVLGTTYTGTVAGYDPGTGNITLTATTTVDIPKNTLVYITRPDLGVIKFSHTNPIFGGSIPPPGPWTSFTITTAENWQYYPLRKADIVNTIAYATDFNFLSNTVNNITGTAGLNLYQLQSNPLIGRISTSKEIGTISKDMIPTLGIYETAPTESLLDLFWETATTGLISDLNWAVLTDFNGATGITPTEFNFWENQNPNGTNNIISDNTNTGESNSPFITRNFFITDNVSNELTPTSCTLYSVFDSIPGTPTDVTSKFQLITVSGVTPSYRIKILTNFEFNEFSPNTLDNYNFTLEVVYAGITSLIKFSGKLKNNEPTFLQSAPLYDRTIGRSATDIVQITATNGSFLPTLVPPVTAHTNGLYWQIISGNTHVPPYFDIDSGTGLLKLINPLVPLGVYPLTIRVWDAASFSTTPPSLLNPLNTDLGSKHNDIAVRITIGDDPVDDYLQYWEGSVGDMPNINIDPDATYSTGYFGVYVGPTVDPVAAGILPTLPFGQTLSTDFVFNPQVQNGALGIPGYPSPTGLTKGGLRFRWNIEGSDPLHGLYQFCFLLIYYRPNATSSWQIIKDDNYAGAIADPWWGSTDIASSASPDTLAIKIQNSLTPDSVTGSIKVSQHGEYFFALKAHKRGLAGPTVVVEDANYYYNKKLAIYPSIYDHYEYPFLPRERFMVGLVSPSGAPSGVPYNTFSAEKRFDWTTGNTTVTTIDPITPFTKFQIVPNALTPQITPGVWVTNITGGATDTVKVVGFDIATNTVTIGTGFVHPIANGNTINFKELRTAFAGIYATENVWASTKDATFINQFYTVSDFNSLWYPPVADKFYNFMSYVNGNPHLPLPLVLPPYTIIPNGNRTGWNSAQIKVDGEIQSQTLDYNIKTSHGGDRPFAGEQNFQTTTFAGNILGGSWATILDITSTTIEVGNLPLPIAGLMPLMSYITWSTESTTPTIDYYPNETIEGTEFIDGGGGEGAYRITGLTPNTTYYILGYYYDENGYINGDFHPIVATTEA